MKKLIMYMTVFILTSISCVEELNVLELSESGFEDFLVVEANITDEMKTQVVLLSRVYQLGGDGPLPESGALIQVISSNNETYDFQEVEPGKYESVTQFSAQNDIKYKIEISTSNNETITSSESQLEGKSVLDDVYFERNFNENNDEGVSIFINASDPTGKAKYYRYTYEETYKIIAPKYSSLDLHYTITYYDTYSEIVYFTLPKEEQQQICYNTVPSQDIILNSNVGFSQQEIDSYRVRFLSRYNTIISHRYSILVSQYVQSLEAQRYYENLRNLSTSEGILSQTQPGFVNGNLFSINTDRKVVGIFQVSSVDKRRVYFNYADLFPGEDLPPYFQSCTPFAPLEANPGFFPTYPLADAIDQGNKYFQPNEDIMPEEGSYDLVAPICGNCTVMGNNYPPDFWEE